MRGKGRDRQRGDKKDEKPQVENQRFECKDVAEVMVTKHSVNLNLNLCGV